MTPLFITFLAIAGAAASSPHNAENATMADRIQDLEKAVEYLKAQDEYLKAQDDFKTTKIQELKGTIQDDAVKIEELVNSTLQADTLQADGPGEIRIFGLDNCPPGYDKLNQTAGEMMMSTPEGAHALAKRVLASSRYAAWNNN
jgi:hypothetical protein